MRFLELKVPPVVLLVLAAGLMRWLASLTFPPLPLPAAVRLTLAFALGLAGLGIGLAGIVAFRRARTTVDPLHPEAATSLVSGGIYRHTRNPMYLGMLLLLAGWAAWLAAPAALLGLPVFVLCINRLQIVPEERALSARFGTAFESYRSRVRRWL